MTAQPIHTIEVEHETDEDGTTVSSIRFTCHAPAGVACKSYPGCECEDWSYHDDPPDPGHEAVPQQECWLVPWFEAEEVSELVENAVLMGAAEDGSDLDGYSHQDLIVSGPVQLVFDDMDYQHIEIRDDVDTLPAVTR